MGREEWSAGGMKLSHAVVIAGVLIGIGLAVGLARCKPLEGAWICITGNETSVIEMDVGHE